MSTDKVIKSFTAFDIEKYHKGLLSPKEMHDLEKAALDDPFLADALEGYAVPGVNVATDIAELKKRLAEKTGRDKVIPLPAPKTSFPWLRIAAMIVLIAGAGFLVYQFAFTNNSEPIAQVDKKTETLKSPDTSVAGNSSSTQQQQATKQPDTFIDSKQKANAPAVQPSTKNDIAKEEAKDNSKPLGDIKSDELAVAEKPKQQIASGAPSIVAQENKVIENKKLIEYEPQRKQAIAKDAEMREKNEAFFYKTKTDSSRLNYGIKQDDKVAAVRGNKYDFKTSNQSNDNSEGLMNNQRANVFRGQVIDADNKAVPFANITNTADNIGTYTDVRGNFILTSPDSVLNVQVRSLGYDNNNTQLRTQQAPAPLNRVIMQEDRNSLAEVVISNKKVNSTRSRTSTMVLDEPEPVDGWGNYDTYIANNLNVPETVKSRQTGGGEVKLSFEVNTKGEPINITVDKSLCESCDKEAIRLVKEGPKWKRKSRKGRTSVTISF